MPNFDSRLFSFSLQPLQLKTYFKKLDDSPPFWVHSLNEDKMDF